MSKDVKRLADEFQPTHYILDIKPNRENKTFTGTVIITGRKINRPSKRLTFHQVDLKVTHAQITKHDKKGDEEIELQRINKQKKYDEVRLHTNQLLYPGNYTIRLEFKGKITRQMNGIYPCFFTYKNKKQKLIATQFESHHAREVFPCIDEPSAKATFDLTLTTPAGETVLGNTPIKVQRSEKDSIVTTFETTPKMSTYLLAFVYGNLGYKETETKDGVKIRLYATPENVQFTDFALEMSRKTLEFYNDYFGIDYPLPKCDLVALPDFAAGAMENWGLITFREQALLVDPANTTVAMKQYVAMVVGHELAHQWFGNLVTMRWWTDLWLNEGFASWIEYLAVDEIFPEWQMWTQFSVDEQLRALKLDALEHTHAVEVPVRHPDEIRSIFDTISYSKGSSVIHMLYKYLGAEDFRNGLRHYLQTHAYGNTDTVDLWNALEEISGKPVKEFMHAWTSLPGFPLLETTIENGTVKLSQERFYVNPETENKEKSLWPIPLLAENELMPQVFENKSDSFIVSDTHNFKLNRGQNGYYRTVYNATHLERLGELIKKGQLPPLDRLGILSDVFEAAKAGQTSTSEALHFLEFFNEENDNAVWDVIASGILSTRMVMDDENLRELMNPFIQRLTAKQLKRLGWNAKKSEPHFDKLLRPTIIGLASGAKEPAVVKECLRLFNEMKTPEDIEPELRGVVYATAVRNGDKKTFDKLFAIHETITSSEERTTIAAALTNFKQPDLINKALSKITTDSVRLQDVGYWVVYSFMNRHSRDATWKWMVDNWGWLGKNLGMDLSFYRFPMYAANAYSKREFLDVFKDFFIPKKEPAFARAIDQGIEVIIWQSAWKERDFKEVEAFFKARQE